jgi:hypothetical protein
MNVLVGLEVYLTKRSVTNTSRKNISHRGNFHIKHFLLSISIKSGIWYRCETWPFTLREEYTKVYPKVSGLSPKEIYAYLRYNLLRNNRKGYGGKTH